ncbi:hypothetical protein NQ318_009805 [Aromia moschata]|uniref:Uncharacterized protein n=1 Tax=Aromia moschata TaxID=1265417 RepID=A0AAV8XMF0_9CUCU|nr:hypothetical protein NQ318_009805 [Aromia moschata]
MFFQYVYALCMGFVAALPPPSYLKPCSLSDPKFEQCCLEHGREAIPHLLNGDKKYNIPKLVPLIVPSVTVDAGEHLKVYLKNIKAYGLDKTDLQQVKFDTKRQKITIKLNVDKLSLIGMYSVDGKILILPIKGNGGINITAIDGKYQYDADYTLKEIDGKQHLSISDNDKLTFDLRKAEFHLDNLFNGDKVLEYLYLEFIRLFYLRRELSLQEALELAYAEDDVDITAIYTEPPEISVLSDEDSGAEDDDGDINRLSGRQFRAAMEIPQRNNVRINSYTINQGKDYDIDTQEPLVKEKQTNFVWASGDLQSEGKNFIPRDFSDFADSIPVEVFAMLWDDDILKLVVELVDETTKYALFKNAPDPNITYEEIQCAVAILILSPQMNVFLNENWTDVINEIGGAISQTVESLVRSIATGVFDKISYADLFTE